MERFYDGDQEKLFSEAHVVSPFKTPSKSQRVSLYVALLYHKLYLPAVLIHVEVVDQWCWC